MSRSAVRGVVCMTVCLLAASSAMAQQGRGFGRGGFGFGGGGGSLVQMLSIETVQTELKLTADQKDKVATLQEENRGRGRGGANFQDMTPEERTKFFEEAQKRTEEANKKVTALLNADQNKRVKELQLQQRIQQGGLSVALSDPELAKEFKITDAQKSSIMTIAAAVGEQMRGAFQDGFGPEAQAKIAEIRKSADDEIMAVLTADQKAAIEKAKGAKFDFPAFGRGGRGRRGN